MSGPRHRDDICKKSSSRLLNALTASVENYDMQEFAKPAAAYVLQHFQPSLEKKAVPRRYVKKTMIDLMPDERPDLDKIVSDEIEFVTSKVSFNADWFTPAAYLDLWKKRFAEFLGENTEIQELRQASSRSDPNDANRQFVLVIDSLKGLRRMLKAAYDQWHRNMMAEFMESDMPMEMYNWYNISYIAKTSAINSLAKDLVNLQVMLLHLVRSDEKKTIAELEEFGRRHKKLFGMLMKTSRSESTLRFFLRAANAGELEDLFRSMPLKLDSDAKKNRFAEYLGEFRQSVVELTNHLDKGCIDEDIALNSSDSESFRDFDKKLRQAVIMHA